MYLLYISRKKTFLDPIGSQQFIVIVQTSETSSITDRRTIFTRQKSISKKSIIFMQIKKNNTTSSLFLFGVKFWKNQLDRDLNPGPWGFQPNALPTELSKLVLEQINRTDLQQFTSSQHYPTCTDHDPDDFSEQQGRIHDLRDNS